MNQITWLINTVYNTNTNGGGMGREDFLSETCKDLYGQIEFLFCFVLFCFLLDWLSAVFQIAEGLPDNQSSLPIHTVSNSFQTLPVQMYPENRERK